MEMVVKSDSKTAGGRTLTFLLFYLCLKTEFHFFPSTMKALNMKFDSFHREQKRVEKLNMRAYLHAYIHTDIHTYIQTYILRYARLPITDLRNVKLRNVNLRKFYLQKMSNFENLQKNLFAKNFIGQKSQNLQI
jgi:hypothetical protein